MGWLYLIEILHQTTTGKCIECRQKKLYLIEILHQTTTVTPAAVLGSSLYLIEILHQTTTIHAICRIKKSCILSKFYIKPQLFVRWFLCHSVVSYRNSTSNHNFGERLVKILQLYLIEILHQTTTMFFIILFEPLLYLIEILHQTTTGRPLWC